MLNFDPHSIIGTYGFDMAGYLISSRRPRSLYVQTGDIELVRAVARRFVGCLDELLVDDVGLAATIAAEIPLTTRVYDAVEVEAAVAPFSRRSLAAPPPAQYVVVLIENSFSYKSLLRPGQVPDNILAARRWLQQTHEIQTCVGLLDPVFMGRTALSQLAGHRAPSFHFRVGQQALDNIYVTGPRAWVSYIALLGGTRKEGIAGS